MQFSQILTHTSQIRIEMGVKCNVSIFKMQQNEKWEFKGYNV